MRVSRMPPHSCWQVFKCCSAAQHVHLSYVRNHLLSKVRTQPPLLLGQMRYRIFLPTTTRACSGVLVSSGRYLIKPSSLAKGPPRNQSTCGGGEPVDDSREAASDQESQSETTQSDDDSCCLIRLIEIADDEYSDIDTGAQVAPNFDHQMRSIPDLPTGMRPRLNHPGKPSHAGNAGVSPELWSLTIEQFTEFVENCRSATEVWQRLAENKDRHKATQSTSLGKANVASGFSTCIPRRLRPSTLPDKIRSQVNG